MKSIDKDNKEEDKKLKVSNTEAVLILDNIRSVLNVGSIFRTADAIGISKIYLCGYTPAPIDRFGRKRSDLAKSALGAQESVAWESVEDSEAILECLDKLKSEGFKIVALEQSLESVDYKKIKIGENVSEKVAIVLGNEVDGVSKNILEKCDLIAELPMNGKKESLNVGVAAGIFLYRLLDL